MADPAASDAEQTRATIQSKAFVVLLILAAVVGIVVSLASWCYLELVHGIQQGVFVHIPSDLGYHHGPPLWWSLPILALAGLIVAFAIVRLPGRGGHIPAEGLKAGGPTLPIELPGIMLAAFATIGLGLVLGPEAPLIALGSGLGVAAIVLVRKDAPRQVLVVVAAAGSFAAISFLFASPLIGAVIIIEAAGLGGSTLPLVLLPGLLAAGIGSLVSLGMGSLTGLSNSAYALTALPVTHFARPDVANFGWTIALAIAVAAVAVAIKQGGLRTVPIVMRKPFLLLPLAGLVVAGLAIAFSEASGKGVNEVLFSGESALPGLISSSATWSLSALALLIVFKGLAYSVSLGSFRGGPTFPALFLGAAAGIMASRLPGFSLTPAVAVGMGAAFVAVLKLPLSGVLVATVLTLNAGPGAEPLIIVGVVVAYLVTVLLSGPAATQPQAVPSGPVATQPQAVPTGKDGVQTGVS